jgi:lysozyme
LITVLVCLTDLSNSVSLTKVESFGKMSLEQKTFDMTKLREELIKHEGYSESAYPDSLGYWTIGIGHLIDGRIGGKLSQDTIYAIFEQDIENCVKDLDENLFWWRNLDPVRQRALINLCFNMGINKLLGFQNFLAHSQAGNYKEATKHLLDSKWAKQVQKSRRERITQQWEYGI